jgi:hypothetical protein
MATRNCASKDGLSDLQVLILELEKPHPDVKTIKTLTAKYGIPYKTNISEQLDELLIYLNSLSVPPEKEPNQEP